MIHSPFKSEPALRRPRKPIWQIPLIERLKRGACVGVSLSLPYLVYLVHVRAF